MSRLIYALFILINNFAFGQATNTFAVNTQPDRYTITVSSLTDSGPAKPSAITGSCTAKVIIPSKAVCRQKVSTFFIVIIPDTLIGLPAKELTIAAAPARETTTGNTSYTIKGIQAGAGSDELELLLKTPGRIMDNADLNNH